MANRNNVVYNVLPTNDNTAVLAKDLTVGDLTEGKLGFFDAETGVSFDATSDVPKEFFIALGKADGTIRKSAGQNIQKKGILNYQRKNYEAGSPMSVVVSGFKPKFDSEYGFRVEFRNSHIYRLIGHNQFSKAYVVKTPCEADCNSTSECLDPNKLAIQLYNEVNLDSDRLMVASFVADQALTAVDIPGVDADIAEGGTVTLAEVEAIIAENLTNNNFALTVSLKLVPNTVDGGNFNVGLNLNYHKLLETVLIVSPLQNLNCSGTTVTATSPVYAQGTGNNILQKEYEASAWNGAGPYVTSLTTNTAIGNIEYLANKSTNYTQFTLEYDVKSESGWKSYESPLKTIIAIPSGHANTITSVLAMMELIS